ncbi:MAG TPA: crosslink repair DNA glycosylase YcaQ family protein [Acidimicrobiales bacterium]|nr:crosslink repair DNA glycosylase YcaQ family protein [Acidimicrobiales bacterium]
MPQTAQALGAEEARRVALHAQGFLGPRHTGGPRAMLRRLGGVQLDTISVLARSHELVAYARHGAIARARIERDYWGQGSTTFEYWSHAACLLPLEDWPAYGFQRRGRRAKESRWHTLIDLERHCRQVIARLRAEGPLTANELGGAKRGGEWWDWSETKIAAERLLDTGDLVCRERRGFQRVYDLVERAVPAALIDQEWSDEECATRLVNAAGRSLGVATEADLSAYHGVPRKLVRQVMGSTELSAVEVEGWKQPAFVAPGSLDVLNSRARGRSLLISPFDSLIWYRDRAERLFGIRHRLEAYTPKEKRQYGYFAMPVLGGTRMVGLVDPGRRDGALVAKQVTLQTADAVRHVARALHEAASWVGCRKIEVERVDPPERRPELAALLSVPGG